MSGTEVGKVEAAGDGAVRAGATGGEALRERLLRSGPQALTDPELIAVMFATGAEAQPLLKLAESLVRAGGGLRALAQADPQELSVQHGLGRARAAQVLAALELGRRAQKPTETRPRLKTPAEIFRHVWPEMGFLRREVFHVLCLNSRNVLIADVRIAEGSADSCPVDPRDVFRAALSARATAIVLVHNHPSGDPDPSPQDLSLTRQLLHGALLLGLKLLDHLVVGDGAYSSMLEQGRLAQIEREAQGVLQAGERR